MNIPLIPDVLRFVANHISEQPSHVLSWRGMPTRRCFECGCTEFKVLAEFDEEYEIAYSRDAECAACGTALTVPIPSDTIVGIY